jgi:PAS domain-containing protein
MPGQVKASALGGALDMDMAMLEASARFGRQSSCPPTCQAEKPGVGALGHLSTIEDERTVNGDEGVADEAGEADETVPNVIEDSIIENAIFEALVDCSFSVAIALPSSLDCELVAVSSAFEKLTGYDRQEIVGENCRFLNNGCELEEGQRQGLQQASETGCPFTGVLWNRRKGGEFFRNLLSMRGLVLARNEGANDDLWLVVSVQEDVTGRECSAPRDHLPQLYQIASRIRRSLVRQLASLGISGALDDLPGGWKVLPDVAWMKETTP